MPTDKTKPPVITLEALRNDHPDLVKAIFAEGKDLGAERERLRIQAVQAQAMPGHEDLIQSLMFDGETTGEQAAVKVLQAEKKIRLDAQDKLDQDTVAPVNHSTPPDPGTTPPDQEKPFDERVKDTWEKDAKLRSEFGNDFEAYKAYEQAREAGNVKYLKNREKK